MGKGGVVTWDFGERKEMEDVIDAATLRDEGR
jgi:hypothetical protein